MNTGDGCEGGPGSGFGDLGQGTSVTLYDAQGTIIASASLGAGSVGPDDDCVFRFVIPNVPSQAMYQYEVGSHGRLSESLATAQAGFDSFVGEKSLYGR